MPEFDERKDYYRERVMRILTDEYEQPEDDHADNVELIMQVIRGVYFEGVAQGIDNLATRLTQVRGVMEAASK